MGLSTIVIDANEFQSPGKTSNPTEFSLVEPKSPENQQSLQEIIRSNVLSVDQNQDKIADSLYSKVQTNEIDSTLEKEFILMFNDFNFIPSVLPSNIKILNQYKSIPAINIIGQTSKVLELTSLGGLAIIEENHQLEKYLAYSSSQIGVRPTLWDLGFSGSSEFSVAVVDSGIDYTHPAFENRIVATWNAQDNNATTVADLDGHGTHVAGIIAGQGQISSTFSQTARGTLPAGNGNFFADILWANNNKSSSITVGMDWGAQGADSPGNSGFIALIEFIGGTPTLACPACISSSSTGLIETTFSIDRAGDYYVGFGNDAGAAGEFYEGWAEVPQDSGIPSQRLQDGYPSQRGMASNSKIVAVKVLDANNGGDSNDFFNAVDWIIANKLAYNITVVNFSLGVANEKVSSIDSAVATLVNEGLVVVVAAGNEGSTSGGIFSPGSAREAITVGAVNRFNEVAFYSSNGDPTINTAAMKPDLLAPGGSISIAAQGWDTSYPEGLGLIISADSNFVGYNNVEDDYTGQMGTSMATPHVSGIALLLVQRIQETKGWTWSKADVLRIKQALLAGTFEVANIGSAGGESFTSQGIPDQTPAITNAKDFVEGWGALNAQAAFDALGTSIVINSDINVDMALQDPFGTKVKAWTFTASPNVPFTFSANVPVGANVDLLVFDTNDNTGGEINIRYLSDNPKGQDETIIIEETSVKELMVVAKLIDSDNALDNIVLRMDNPNFIPSIDLQSPLDGSFVNTADVKVTFVSTTNQVEAFLDDISQGLINSGDKIIGVSEGVHNLTLVETNSNTGVSATVQVDFTVDLTPPTIISDISTIDGLSIENPVRINFTTNDNYQVDRVEIRVDQVLGDSVLPSATYILVDPQNFKPGLQTISIYAIDIAGNTVFESAEITLINTVFVNKQADSTIELGSTSTISWNAGSTNPGSYEVYWDGVKVDESTWDGSPIEYTPDINLLTLGPHSLRVVAFSVNNTQAQDEITVTVVDTTAPVVTGINSQEVDATNPASITFQITELSAGFIYEVRENSSLVLNVDGVIENKAIISFEISQIPGVISIVEVSVVDSSGNSYSEFFTFTWKDLSVPNISQVSDITMDEGGATSGFEWMWDERFLRNLTIFLDDNEFFFDDSEDVTSISVSEGTLNSLPIGDHRFKLELMDDGGNVGIDVVNVFVVNTNVRDNGSNGGFLPINFGMFLGLLVLIPLILKLKSKNKSSSN